MGIPALCASLHALAASLAVLHRGRGRKVATAACAGGAEHGASGRTEEEY